MNCDCWALMMFDTQLPGWYLTWKWKLVIKKMIKIAIFRPFRMQKHNRENLLLTTFSPHPSTSNTTVDNTGQTSVRTSWPPCYFVLATSLTRNMTWSPTTPPTPPTTTSTSRTGRRAVTVTKQSRAENLAGLRNDQTTISFSREIFRSHLWIFYVFLSSKILVLFV